MACSCEIDVYTPIEIQEKKIADRYSVYKSRPDDFRVKESEGNLRAIPILQPLSHAGLKPGIRILMARDPLRGFPEWCADTRLTYATRTSFHCRTCALPHTIRSRCNVPESFSLLSLS